MPSFKVKPRIPTNDCYVEVWQVVDEKKYFARYVCGQPVWYFVCDPFGYCELDHPCPDDYIFEVCDQDGNVLFKDGNGEENRHPFVDLETKAKQVWLSIQNKHKTEDGLNDWLLSYITPENLAKDPATTQFCPADNWTTCWYDRIGHESVFDYEYLGEKYCIYAITCKHRYCDCVWIEYMAGAKDMDWEYPYFIKYFGSWFNPIYGPMYSERKAVEYVEEALKLIYGDVSSLSIIRTGWCGPYESKVRLWDAAKHLIGKDLSCEHVWAVVRAEREKPTLYTKAEDMERDYPGYKPDHSWKWWW